MFDPFSWYVVSMLAAIVGMVVAVALTTLSAKVLPPLEVLRDVEGKLAIGRRNLLDQKAEHSDVKAKHDEIQAQLAKAQYKINYSVDLEKKIAANETLLQTTQSERRAQQELQAEIIYLREQKQILLEAVAKTTAARVTIAGECDLLRTQQMILLAENESVGKKIENAQSELAVLQKRREVALAGVAEFEAKHAAARANAESNAQQTAAAIEKLISLEAHVQRESESLRLAQINLSASKADLGTVQKHIDTANADLAHCRKKLAQEEANANERRKQLQSEYESDLKRHDDTKRNRGISTGTAADRIADLWEPVISMETLNLPKAKADLSELAALQKVSDDLEKSGLQFSPRVLRAFHTSLKIAHDSPLLVLAGISGTGKSLLPKRYASAMGIQLLSVPVQPRWDSPQDLLGFFNHLQDKYVPTELVRALMQVDRHNKHASAPTDRFLAAPDALLLVLLDEMNLARIEYYFSDFLSVLENRRDGVNLSDKSQRRNAELMLDISDAKGPIPICADRNVFFVGTMNEDESTQTLSDKVVDRANVMRFAPPKKFVPPIAATRNVSAANRLTFPVWEGWINQANAQANRDATNRVERWIAELSTALTRIGKPFGHRVHRAMSAYVRQYPIKGDDGLRDAMSDQIEQKILPKLRGVDCKSSEAIAAINVVKKIVKELNDDLLVQAIEEGSLAQDHLFHWSGVDRVT